jgi:methanogenic corrinoid protein MtbC1
LTEAVVALDEKKVYALVDQYIEKRASAHEIVLAFRMGMVTIGEMFKREEAFISEMMFAGEIMRNILNKLGPLLEKDTASQETLGKVIIGTVKGDVHDLGKDVVIMTLECHGFEVVDLGVDVPHEKVVEALRSNPDAKVLGLSVFLTSVYPATTKTVEVIKEAGLRDGVKIMVGGGPVTHKVAKETGCDYFGLDAVAALDYTKEIYNLS